MASPHYAINPDDPRAPTLVQWELMSESERTRIVEQLPSDPPARSAPEGDRHRIPKEKAVQALGEYFKRMGRSIYLSAELPVYYPNESWFAPDLIAVLDVTPNPREKWVVLHEQRGLDFVLEITLGGDRKKDLVDNVERYARLRIPEYFVLDLQGNRIAGFRLSERGDYERIIPQGGRFRSNVLGLELMIENGRIRFGAGSAVLLESDELIGQLSTMVDELVKKEQDLFQMLEAERTRAALAESRAEEEKSRAEEEKSRAEEEKSRAERLARKLRELGIDPDAH